MDHLSYSLSTAALAWEIVHRVFDCDALLHQTVVEVGHVSTFGDGGPCAFCCFVFAHLLTWTGSGFSELRYYLHGVGFLPNIVLWECTALKEARTFQVRSPWGVQYLQMKRRRFLSASVLQSGLFFVPDCDVLLLLFLWVSGSFFGPNRIPVA